MKVALIKWLIQYLVNNHYYLVYESVVPPSKHLHANPRKRAKVMTEAQDPLECRDEVDLGG